MNKVFSVVGMCLAFSIIVFAGPGAPTRLKCEYVTNPMGIDNPQPVFSWQCSHSERGAMQAGYEVDIEGVGTIMDNASSSPFARYMGGALRCKTSYRWKVRITDDKGTVSPFSDWATFETGMFSTEDWNGAKLLKEGQLFRKEFTIEPGKTVKRAMAYIAAQGLCELRVNGSKIGKSVIGPITTTTEYRMMYLTYDITSSLVPGANAVGIMLAHNRLVSWSQRRAMLAVEIELSDGSRTIVTSDDSWKMLKGGPILHGDTICDTCSSYTDGEKYDARREQKGWDKGGFIETGSWIPAITMTNYFTYISAQLQEIVVKERIIPVKVTQPAPGVYVFDAGKNIAGWAQLKVSGSAGTAVKMQFAEVCSTNGRIYPPEIFDNNRGKTARKTDIYTLKGEGTEVWEPRFSLHGFQYMEVTGFPGTPTVDNFTFHSIQSDVDSTGGFYCEPGLLYNIYQAALNTKKTKLIGFTLPNPAAPEVRGWMKYGMAESSALSYDMAAYNRRWLNDARDMQYFFLNGYIPCLVPQMGKDRDTLAHDEKTDIVDAFGWVDTPWEQYVALGDLNFLQEHYDMMARMFDYLWNRVEANGAICPDAFIQDLYGGDMYNVTPGNAKSDEQLISTALFYYEALVMKKSAGALGKTADAVRYEACGNQIRSAFIDRWYKGDHFSTGQQCENAMPLDFGLVPDSGKANVLRTLITSIRMGDALGTNHLTTGIPGTLSLMKALGDCGRDDTMAVNTSYTLAIQTNYPSWGWMVTRPGEQNTTLWETWWTGGTPPGVVPPREHGSKSRNHQWEEPIHDWYYDVVLGIRALKPGYAEVEIRPQIGGDLSWAQGSINTVRGLVESHWKRSGSDLAYLKTTIPFNSKGVVSVPKLGKSSINVYEGGAKVWDGSQFVAGTEGIDSAWQDPLYVNFSVGSGTYAFGHQAVSVIRQLAQGKLAFSFVQKNARFRISLPAKESVDIRIFDLRGREVVKVFDGISEAGTHNIVIKSDMWASGTYLYSVIIGNTVNGRVFRGRFLNQR